MLLLFVSPCVYSQIEQKKIDTFSEQKLQFIIHNVFFYLFDSKYEVVKQSKFIVRTIKIKIIRILVWTKK